MLKRFLHKLIKETRVEIFARYCFFSAVSKHKKRPSYFSREKCYHNLLDTTAHENVGITFFLDTFHQKGEDHFLLQQKKYPVILLKEGTEAATFLKMVDHVSKLSLAPDTILYFVEDDYLHRPHWVKVMREGLQKGDYVTLYDHKDKYSSAYSQLKSQVFVTESSHWRTTPSTTNTYAMRCETFRKHIDIHRAYSQNRSISADHEKFLHLQKEGAVLLSPIPGWSTHMETEYVSPCIDWQEISERGVS